MTDSSAASSNRRRPGTSGRRSIPSTTSGISTVSRGDRGAGWSVGPVPRDRPALSGPAAGGRRWRSTTRPGGVLAFAYPDAERIRSPRYDRLTPADCDRLHDASLAILERTGCVLHDPEAVERLHGAGARVDGGRVHVPGSLVEWALSAAPKGVTLHDRSGRPALAVEGDNVFFGPGSDCLNVLDHRTGQRRPAVLGDARDGLTLVDALPDMDFAMSMFLPSDVDPALADRHQMALMLQHTTKPLVVVTYDVDAMLDAIAMAEAVAGGAEALRERPNVALYINVTRGLVHNEDSLRKLLILAERGLPAMWIPVTSSGPPGRSRSPATSPSTTRACWWGSSSRSWSGPGRR